MDLDFGPLFMSGDADVVLGFFHTMSGSLTTGVSGTADLWLDGRFFPAGRLTLAGLTAPDYATVSYRAFGRLQYRGLATPRATYPYPDQPGRLFGPTGLARALLGFIIHPVGRLFLPVGLTPDYRIGYVPRLDTPLRFTGEDTGLGQRVTGIYKDNPVGKLRLRQQPDHGCYSPSIECDETKNYRCPVPGWCEEDACQCQAVACVFKYFIDQALVPSITMCLLLQQYRFPIHVFLPKQREFGRAIPPRPRFDMAGLIDVPDFSLEVADEVYAGLADRLQERPYRLAAGRLIHVLGSTVRGQYWKPVRARTTRPVVPDRLRELLQDRVGVQYKVVVTPDEFGTIVAVC